MTYPNLTTARHLAKRYGILKECDRLGLSPYLDTPVWQVTAAQMKIAEKCFPFPKAITSRMVAGLWLHGYMVSLVGEALNITEYPPGMLRATSRSGLPPQTDLNPRIVTYCPG